MESTKSQRRPGALWDVLLLALCGEAIFALPFHVARFFRPTLLVALDLTHTELGTLQSAYGVMALLCYFPGGVLADRFSPRLLLSIALGATAVGGVYFATLPSYAGLLVLHLYFGLTTILLFWGALIRATRSTFSESRQGRAFGLLEGGRGILAAAVATGGVVLLAWEPAASLPGEARRAALSKIILVYTAVTGALGVATYLGLSDSGPQTPRDGPSGRFLLRRSLVWLKHPQLWLLSLVIVCAYCSYKAVDFYSVYAVEAFGLDEVRASSLATLSVWIRPFAALAAGILAERISASRLTFVAFVALGACYLPAMVIPGRHDLVSLLVVMVLSTSLMVYAFRSLYFIIVSERGVPHDGTGTAVGIISVIGFTPDFFFPTLAGLLLDSNSGPDGYRAFFGLLVGAALLGAVASYGIERMPPVGREASDAARGS